MSTVEDWIRDLVSTLTAPLRTIVEAVRQRLGAIYAAFTDVLARVRAGFTRWVNAGRAWLTAQTQHALAVYNRLRWIITVLIPTRVGEATTALETWVRRQVANAAAILRAEATQVTNWLSGRVSDVLRLLSQVRDYAVQEIGRLWADMLRIRDRVVALLFDPARLAAWVLGPLIELLIRYAIDNLDRLAEYAWSNRRDVESQAIATTERILDRIL